MIIRPRLLLLLMLWPLAGQAFYQAEKGEFNIEARGFVHALGLAANNPNDNILFADDKILGGAISGRLMLDIDRDVWHLELHAVQSYQDNELQSGGRRFSFLRDVERSDALDWRFANNDADLAIDRFNLLYGSDRINLKLGRQPVNLAATYFFTPNDFFAPFAAQTFFRTYKPGVDAARLDWQWQDLSQLTLLAVLDYRSDPTTSTGWQSSPDWGNTAYLARISSLLGDFEWGLLAAEIDNDEIAGFDFQGELFGWLGVRGEGHVRFFDQPELQRDSKLALSFEYRPDSRTSYRLEQFYQRSGVTDPRRYLATDTSEDEGRFYLARHYTALGASYEMTPLLNTDALLMFNHNDSSSLLALYANYSLSDESELAIGINLPLGDLPRQGQLESEFGSYPKALTIELRSYF